MCGTSNLECLCGKSIINVNARFYCPNKMCSEKLPVHKKVLVISIEAIISVLNVRPYVRFAVIPLKFEELESCFPDV